MILSKGSYPVCVLGDLCIEQLQLSKQFIFDVATALPTFSHESIAIDLFSGLLARETVTRISNGCLCNGKGRTHNSVGCFDIPFQHTKAFSLISIILLRDNVSLTTTRKSRASKLTRDQRHLILSLLYQYGVQCADGSCCGLARDPIPSQKIYRPLCLKFG